MPTTTIRLPNGTVITVEGTVDDTKRVVAAVSGNVSPDADHEVQTKEKKSRGAAVQRTATEESEVDLVGLVNLAKTCPDSNEIASKILDARNTVNRILLPLYVVHEHKDNAFGLTSGQISKVLKELGTPIDLRNVSTILSGQARAFVTGDKVRVRGQAVAYKIIRRGVLHLKQVLGRSSQA